MGIEIKAPRSIPPSNRMNAKSASLPEKPKVYAII
jgi:hypothetical protein